MLSRLRCNGNLYAFDTHDLVRVLQNDELQQFNRGNNAMVSGIFIAAITPVMMITLEYDFLWLFKHKGTSILKVNQNSNIQMHS